MRIRAQDENNNFTLLRLLLALAVVLGHFKLLDGIQYPHFPFNLADAAVDCFFIVSGFLITLSYQRSQGIWPFYIRRFFRLYPMYATIVLIQAGIMMAMLPNGPFSAPYSTMRFLAANLAFTNFLQYDIGGVVHGLAVPGLNPSLWTLKIEIGFYAIVPLIFLAMQRWRWKALATIFVASVVYQVTAMHIGEPRYAKQLPGQMQFFVVGMALYLYARDVRVPVWVTVAVTVVFLTSWTWLHPIPPGICPLLVGAFVFCIALCTPVIRMNTDMSYSVYLVHGPILQTSLLLGLYSNTPKMLAIVLALVLFLACIAEALIERPGNEFGRRLSWRVSRARAPVVAHVA